MISMYDCFRSVNQCTTGCFSQFHLVSCDVVAALWTETVPGMLTVIFNRWVPRGYLIKVPEKRFVYCCNLSNGSHKACNSTVVVTENRLLNKTEESKYLINKKKPHHHTHKSMTWEGVLHWGYWKYKQHTQDVFYIISS